MSIATLKKKTGNLYNSQSVGYKNFSLNGTHRSQGWVGQTVLSRSFPRTLARGNVNIGHGGLYGTYNTNNGHSITSGLIDLNNNEVIKPSVGNTSGMLNVRNNCLKDFNYKKQAVVKQKFGLVKKTQSDHISQMAKCTLASYEANKKTKDINIVKESCNTLDSKYMNTGKPSCNITKNTENTVLQEGEYINNMTSKCLESITYPTTYTRGPIP
jgi:hypothetical protein